MKTLFIALALLFSGMGLATERGLLVTKLHHGDYWISVYSTKGGTRYDVNRPNGDLLAQDATVEELKKKVPEVYEFVKSSVALDASSESRMDASSDNL